MSRIVFVLLVVVAVLSTVLGSDLPGKESEKKKCGKNEEWTDCNSLCSPACGQMKPTVCPDICIPGCRCKHGFLKNKRNQCVLPRDCDC
ncbi:chymotrypsin inhibitor-like [Harpegnathos saltator]|uniref:chymotrypsin inhibitor-like n=1 Tax=Harpegnathos saltator TaxID=610380 RepID=UPI00058B43BF|nr:chymotrypsin inhibitor-like [Harpegnathos saltator]